MYEMTTILAMIIIVKFLAEMNSCSKITTNAPPYIDRRTVINKRKQEAVLKTHVSAQNDAKSEKENAQNCNQRSTLHRFVKVMIHISYARNDILSDYNLE